MENIEMNITYAGADVEVFITPENGCAGMMYAVEADGKYLFTFLENEEGDWSVMKEANAYIPVIDEELYKAILKKLNYQLLYAA